METIETLRKEIDRIDQDLTDLLLQRMQITAKIGNLKAEQGMHVLQQDREKVVLAQVLARVPEDDAAAREAVRAIFEAIMAQSRKAQEQKIKDRRET